MEAATQKTLEKFVEKARQLENSQFAKLNVEHGLSLEIKFGSSSQIKRTIPGREPMEASILRGRLRSSRLYSFVRIGA
jgi:hypothetical protein